MRRLTVLAALLFATTGAQAEVHTYKIDNTHSFANWELRHVVARTSGTFHDVQGKIMLDTENVAKSSVEASISVYSLNSSHLKRDIHVLTEDFLDVRNYPDMKFVSTQITPATPEKGTLTGTLALHGVSKPVTLDYQILGIGKDPWGGTRIGLKASGRILRGDFGISKYVPTGPVGNEVDVTLLIEGIKQDPVPAAVAAPAVAAPVVAAPAVQPAPAVTPAAPAPAPEKKESTKDKLKKKLEGLLN